MTDHDATMNLWATARGTHIDNTRRQQRRQSMGREEAEDRAFFGERAQRQAEGALAHERQEHALTKLAMHRLICQSEAMRRTLKHLAERWVSMDGATVDDMAKTFVQKSEALAQVLLDKPGNLAKLEHEVERLCDAQRVTPFRPAAR